MDRSLGARPSAAIVGALVVLAACSTGAAGEQTPSGDAVAAAQSADARSIDTATPSTEIDLDADAPDDADPDPTTSTSSSSPAVDSTTTTTEPPHFNVDCVVVAAAGDTLTEIVARFDDGETVNRVSVRTENALVDETLSSGQIVDVCPGNGIDDDTGEQRVEASEEIVTAAITANIELQQAHLNDLFTDLGTVELAVDGVSGPVTQQRLCAARLALGFDPSTDDMASGSEEEQALFDADVLPPPPVATTDQDRWALINQTCQFMFVGSVDELVFGFPTSTGQAGFETRVRERQRAFRFDPAVNNGGWHDSSEFPVSIDNPINGNMYKPIYFDGGQAIHGANNVPTSPQSKGCARLSLEHQDVLVEWLGLSFDTAPTWSERSINLTVSTEGAYVD